MVSHKLWCMPFLTLWQKIPALANLFHYQQWLGIAQSCLWNMKGFPITHTFLFFGRIDTSFITGISVRLHCCLSGGISLVECSSGSVTAMQQLKSWQSSSRMWSGMVYLQGSEHCSFPHVAAMSTFIHKVLPCPKDLPETQPVAEAWLKEQQTCPLTECVNIVIHTWPPVDLLKALFGSHNALMSFVS